MGRDAEWRWSGERKGRSLHKGVEREKTDDRDRIRGGKVDDSKDGGVTRVNSVSEVGERESQSGSSRKDNSERERALESVCVASEADKVTGAQACTRRKRNCGHSQRREQ